MKTKPKKNSKVLEILFIIVIVLFISIFLTVYFIEQGKHVSNKLSREIVYEYLETNFPDYSYRVDGVGFYPGEAYIVHFKSKDGTIEGNLGVKNGRSPTMANSLKTE